MAKSRKGDESSRVGSAWPRDRREIPANLRAQNDDLRQLQHGRADGVEHVLQLVYHRYQGLHGGCGDGATMKPPRRVDERIDRDDGRSVTGKPGSRRSSNARSRLAPPPHRPAAP